MAQAADGIASALEQLNERVRELECRVAVLESQTETPPVSQPQSPALALEQPAATWRGFPSAVLPDGAVPVVGRAVLGIAGAYLLRAIAESRAVPQLPVLVVAIVYAAMWMVWAARDRATSRFASVTYGITSAMILSPLLWESTVRFRVLSPAFAAVVLVAFVVLALALGWRRNLQSIPWVAVLATVSICLALIIGTRELVPLTAALLVTAVAVEMVVCLGHRLSVRALPALAADFALWLLVLVMTSPEGVPEGYHPVSSVTITLLCLALLAIYGGSIGARSFGLRRQITFFEIGQGILVFALASYGSLRATQGLLAPALGVLFLLLAAVCYWGALRRFVEEAYTRNRRVSATWAAALLLGGSSLVLPVMFRVPFLCLAAVAAAFVYTRTLKFSLGLHASFYLAAAAAASPLPIYAANALAGTVPGTPALTVWAVVISAVVCYVVASSGDRDRGKRRLLWVAPAALVGFAGTAMAIAALVWLLGGRVELNPSRLAVVRTMVNCALALGFGFLAPRWKRAELGWVAYTAVAFGTLKLLFEDLRFGNAASLVVSLLFYGLVLILLPRWTRRGQTTF